MEQPKLNTPINPKRWRELRQLWDNATNKARERFDSNFEKFLKQMGEK